MAGDVAADKEAPLSEYTREEKDSPRRLGLSMWTLKKSNDAVV